MRSGGSKDKIESEGALDTLSESGKNVLKKSIVSGVLAITVKA